MSETNNPSVAIDINNLPEGVSVVLLNKALAEYNKQHQKSSLLEDAIKARNIRIYEVNEDDDSVNVRNIVVIRPSNSVITQIERYGDADPNRARRLSVKNCVFAADGVDVLNNQFLYYGSYSAVLDMLPMVKARLKNG
jgi:hypothetical protein